MTFRYKHGNRPLEGYTIQRGVGLGGFGEVYYAVSDGGRQVALKCLHHNPEIELRGVGQCMNLKSPYLVTIFDVKTAQDGMACVIMEYVAGPSLRELLHESPEGMGPQKAAFFLREIARGLGYLHERGIVHRDLKPENIFFEDGFVKIGDYGLSKFISVSRQSCQTISVGTVHYMAPEIGTGRYHRGIDIYALGVILFEMLTGRVPFTGDSFGEILLKHLSMEPDLSGIPEPFRSVIGKALRKNPDERSAKVEEMVDDLLRHPEIQAMVRDFRPESLSRTGQRPPEPAQETLILPSPTPGRSPQPAVSPPPLPALQPPPLPAIPPLGASPGAPAVPPPIPQPGMAIPGPAEPARGPAPSQPWLQRAKAEAFSQENRQKTLLAVMTAVAMSVAAGLLSSYAGSEFRAGLGTFFIILSGAAAVLVSEREVPGRFAFEPGVPRRLLLLCMASPLYLIFANAFLQNGKGYGVRGTVISLIISTAIINWGERTRKHRLQRISLGQAFTAGLCGFVVAMILQGFFDGLEWAPVAGALAAMSLVVNTKASFEVLQKGSRKAGPEAQGSPREAASWDWVKRWSGKRAQDPQHKPVWDPSREALVDPMTEAPLPRTPAPVHPVRSAGGRPAMPFWARLISLGLSALLLATGLSCLAGSLFGDLRGDEEIAFGIAAFSTLAYFGFCFKLGTSRTWMGFWQLLRWILIIACVCTAVGSGLVIAIAPLRGDDFLIGITMIIFSLVFGLFLGLLPRRLAKSEKKNSDNPDHPDDPPGSSPGWGTLGSLLVTLGIATVLGSALLSSLITGSSPELPRELSGSERILVNLVHTRSNLLIGCAFFVPGLFCILRSRQSQGAAHVLRGAVGFASAAALVYLASRLIPERLEQGAGATLSFRDVPPDNLISLLILGIGSALFLFWPARAPRPEITMKNPS